MANMKMRKTWEARSDPLDALGSPSLGVLTLQPPATFLGGETVYPLVSEVVSVGRGLHNAAVLLDPTVSREHLHLFYTDEGWVAENASTSKTLWVNGVAFAPGERAALPAEAMLRIGQSVLRLLTPQPPVADDGGVSGASASGERQEAQASATRLLHPGVTLQFALSGRRSRLWQALAALGLTLFFICSLITLGLIALAGRTALATGGPAQLLSAAAIPFAPTLGVALLVGALDRYEREPWLLLLGAFVWGAVIAIPSALGIERGLGALLLGHVAGAGLLAQAGGRAIIAAVVEEGVKGAGLVLLLLALRDEFDNITDGVLYGVMIGAGFALVENVVYFATTPGDGLAALLVGRVALGWLSHSTYTALLGASLGYLRETRAQGWRRALPWLGFAAAVTLHFFFDFVTFTTAGLAYSSFALIRPRVFAALALAAAYLPLFAAQAALLRVTLVALRGEAGVVRRYLADEIPFGVVTPDEYVIVQDARLRGRVERRILWRFGPRAYLTARALHQTATGLAFRKWHVAQGDPAKPTPRQPEEVYRARIAKLRGSLLRQIQSSKE